MLTTVTGFGTVGIGVGARVALGVASALATADLETAAVAAGAAGTAGTVRAALDSSTKAAMANRNMSMLPVKSNVRCCQGLVLQANRCCVRESQLHGGRIYVFVSIMQGKKVRRSVQCTALCRSRG